MQEGKIIVSLKLFVYFTFLQEAHKQLFYFSTFTDSIPSGQILFPYNSDDDSLEDSTFVPPSRTFEDDQEEDEEDNYSEIYEDEDDKEDSIDIMAPTPKKKDDQLLLGFCR